MDQDFLDGKPATSSMCLQEFNSLIEENIIAAVVAVVGDCCSTFLGSPVALYCCTKTLSSSTDGSQHHLID